MNEAIGAETYTLPWRVSLRKQLRRGAGKMIADYEDRRDNHGCDPNQEMVTGAEEEEEALERALPESCQEMAQPLKQLAV